MKKYLPIGTIIKLNGEEKYFMTIGYCSKLKLKKLLNFDYIVCEYPIGVFDLKKVIPIKHDYIEKIYYMGYNSKQLKKINEINLVVSNLSMR